MPAQSKVEVVAQIKKRIDAAKGGVLLVDYRGLSVLEMATLRRNLRDTGGEMCVYKNRLVQIALRENALPAMDELLAGPSAFIFIDGDPVASAKALAAFAKDHHALEMKGGLVQNEVLDSESLIAFSKLPSREELIARLLGTLTNPARGMVTVLGGVSRGLVTVLDRIAKEKEAA
jgi:large subunit ribosomal protein L10